VECAGPGRPCVLTFPLYARKSQHNRPPTVPIRPADAQTPDRYAASVSSAGASPSWRIMACTFQYSAPSIIIPSSSNVVMTAA